MFPSSTSFREPLIADTLEFYKFCITILEYNHDLYESNHSSLRRGSLTLNAITGLLSPRAVCASDALSDLSKIKGFYKINVSVLPFIQTLNSLLPVFRMKPQTQVAFSLFLNFHDKTRASVV